MVEHCPNCGSSAIEEDPSRGDVVCTNCCVVLSDNHIITDEVQFMENSHGQSSAVGQFIAHNSSVPTMFKGCQGTFSKESREITHYKGKRRITDLGNQLNINTHCQEISFNFFKLCVSKGLTRGRGSFHVIGACVYMACRTEATPHMLIDISDALEIDVYELGRIYLRLSTELCLNIPVIDPCLYIIRFANKLKFGNKTHEVAETALRLVKRMKKDWMHTGRRPSGVCGAALVIAARFHQFNRTIQDVIKIVRVHESTIRKRLTEFGSTPSSGLSVDEFMNTDLDKEEDPPAFKAARRREEEEKLQKLIEDEKDINNQFTDLQLEIERILSERKKKLRGMWAAAAATSSAPPTPTRSICGEREESDAVQFITEATMQSIQECIRVSNGDVMQQDIPKEIMPTTASMGIKQTIEESMEIRPSEPEPEESGILDLEGIDDDEIDTYILTDRERDLKTDHWMNCNKDYLEEQEKKKEQERLEEEQRIKEGLPPKKKKIYKRKNKKELPANTAGEAIERLIKVKRLSNKIDYSVLKNLNGDSDDVPDNCSSKSKVSSSRSSRSSKRSASNMPPLPDSFREIMQSLTGKRTASEALLHDQQADDNEDLPFLKTQKVEEDVPDDDDDEIDEEEEEAPEPDDDCLQTLLVKRSNYDDDYDY
uniref:B-related factor 1 n=1 Tax=Hirondellea gigas TaxID=1518452 RepID=A0A2P2I239_9CRUS